MRTLSRRRRCSCGCGLAPPGMGHPSSLDVFRGLGLVAVLCWQAVSIFARKLGRDIKDWVDGDWHDLDDDSSSVVENWKCELCSATGKGDARSFFSLDEVEHLLETGCMGSLRLHKVPELATSSHVQEEKRHGCMPLPAWARRPLRSAWGSAEALSDLDRSVWEAGTSPLVTDPPPSDLGAIDISCGDWCSSPPIQSLEPETARQAVLGMGSTWVEAGQRLFINVVAKEAFKVQRMIVPSTVAENFMIEDVMIGRRQLLPSRVPAILFTETCTAITFFGGEVGYPGVITISVTNMSKKGSWFQGAVIGPTTGNADCDSSNKKSEARELMRKRVENGFALRGGAAIAAQDLNAMLRETKS